MTKPAQDRQIIDGIMRREGWPTYTNHKHDRGGPTKGGITLDTLRAWRRDASLRVPDLKGLSTEEARAIYQFLYLQPFQVVANDALRAYLIDLGVLRGPRAAARMLQDIVGTLADGWIGPKTLAAMTVFRQDHLLIMLIGSRFTHISEEVRRHPKQRWAMKGWRNRNASFLPASESRRLSVAR